MNIIFAKKNTIITLLTALVLFARCNLGLSHGAPVVLANLLACGLAAIFCLVLLLKEGAGSYGLLNLENESQGSDS